MEKEIKFITKEKYEMVEISSEIEEAIKEFKVKEGLILIFVPHSTCGIIFTENEAGLKKDWLNFFKEIIKRRNFFHNQIDNNALAHLLSGFIGQSKMLAIKEGRIFRGPWQQIFLAEFDGPRERKVFLKILKEK